MPPKPRIYLDNAATSWPKPEAVYDAVDRYQREIGAPNGRSGYREAQESNRIVERARRGVAELIGAADPSQIVFGFNGTDVLNIAIRGIVRPGDHVVTTVCDHNSVLRPLRDLHETADVAVTYVPCDGEGFVSPDDVRAALRPNTRLVAVNHASNVTGAIQPIEEIGRVVRESDALFLVDAAQSLGHVPIDVRKFEVDLLAAPGHKGLLGPTGHRRALHPPGRGARARPLRCGGTGTQSDEDRQPDVLPDKYEPGNHNLPGLAGLAAAAEFLQRNTIEAIHAHHAELTAATSRWLARRSTASRSTARNRPPIAQASSASRSKATIRRSWPRCSSRRTASNAAPACNAPRACTKSLGTAAGGGTLRLAPATSQRSKKSTPSSHALQEVSPSRQ